MDVDIVNRTFHTDAKGRLHIRIEIDSGARWQIAAVDLAVADAGVDTSALRGLIGLEPGSPFLYGKILGDERAVLGYLNNMGYAHARVANRLTLDPLRRSASVVYDIHPGRRMYFGQIRIVDRRSGSSEKLQTRQALVRRHLTFAEGERYDPQALRVSRNNLAKTDLFRSVTLEVPAAAATDSLQPVEVVLQERKYIHLEGNGFLNNAEPGVSANLQHANWLGRGMRLGLDASLGRPLQGTTAYVTERDVMSTGADLTVS
ncbi:MAG: hypothetical protein IH895_04045, partial [Planctomycetes bacterium]|nr:hypothetical protein [Planctomycetota bacterium]